MALLIETLENRSFFSVTLPMAHPVAAIHQAAITAPVKQEPVKQEAAVVFQGTAVNTDSGKTAANLTITIRQADGVYRVDILGIDPKTAAQTKLSAVLDSKGHFACDVKETNGILHLDGLVNTAKKTVAGTWTETRKDGGSHGTFSAVMINNTPAPTPTPTPKPAPVTSVQFNGASVNQNHETAPVTMAVTKTDTGYRGVLHILHSDGKYDEVVVTIDTKGHLAFDGPHNGDTLHVEGQLSSDGMAITAAYTTGHPDGTSSHGTITLSRQK